VPATSERLYAALADLPVVIERVATVSSSVAVPSYGGARPTSLAILGGAGREGYGEHVGWTDAAHAAFRAAATEAPTGSWRIGEWSAALRRAVDEPYDRAALESAAIDLALRQRTTTLASLAGTTPRPLRHVVSFARTDDPAAEAARWPDVALKVDVDPAWSEATWRRLARAGRVAVLDWKGGGDAGAYARALDALPDALHEDPRPPWPDGVRRRLALDAAVTAAAALGDPVPTACNLKPARMGGVLEALAAAVWCDAHGVAVYVGGMFEIGVGRRQLRDLAAILCPEGPNDVATIPLADAPQAP
jgi:hypothetical protein